MQPKQIAPKPVTTVYIFLPTKPKEDSIYFSIIKVSEKEESELHYTFLAFEDGEFTLPVHPERTFEVIAWAELIHPSLVLKEPPPPKRIITPGSRFIPRRN